MTQIRGPIGKFTPGRRLLAAAAITVATALALTACGTEENGGGRQTGSAGSPTASQQPWPEQGATQALFDRFEKACPKPGVNSRRPAGASKPDTAEPETIAPGETPPADPIEPAFPTGPEAELDDRDWCVSAHHEQRVIAALQKVADPTPAKVRKTLNGLGYPDERIHHLKQDGKKTRFHLDLREGGGRLCESGLAAGAVSDVVPCVAVAEGPFEVTSGVRP
ncbi:hypothetical protein [Streptomyces sp. st77]|uniref:hypothetical protein n=1 Tax=Streptomyces sp. st77 TaxID=1828074 RepID=UPI000BFBF848|nr:hypothetical protein [Streptomyces sp. st77]